MINELLHTIEVKEKFSSSETFDLYKSCSILLLDNQQECEKLIINILNNKDKFDRNLDNILSDLVESTGFYPYLDKEGLNLESTSCLIRKHFHHSENLEKFFHQEQKYLLSLLLKSDKNLIVSAPTSFGKSLLFEEIVSAKIYSDVVIIQPTLALLDETRQKLLKYKDYYKIIVRTSQEPSTEKGNIFLFTAERVNEYQHFTKVQFLVIDEFYKLSGNRDDERSSSLNNAFHFLLQSFNPKFYLLGPNIDGISEGFEEKYNATFYKSNYSLVDSRQINLYNEYEGKFGEQGEKARFKERTLFELLLKLDNEQTIIYCSSPNRVRSLAKKFSLFLLKNKIENDIKEYPLVAWIKQYISKNWSLIDFLRYNIGIHDGALQKHITTSIIDYFNNGNLKYLFCTSTIIEGVNTSAKNIIFFDSKKGTSPVDYFDYSNIRGRAGRMMIHFVGKIYNFNKPPLKKQIFIDIPFFQQNPIKDEVLIQLDDSEIINKKTEQYTYISNLPEKEKEIIKRNAVKVKGQQNIFEVLRTNIYEIYPLINWNKFPTYEQLNFVLSLAWYNLIIEGETIRPMTIKKLVYMTFNYGLNQSVSGLIKSTLEYKKTQNNKIVDLKKKKSETDILDETIMEVFQVMKHWFQYKIPKWLSVINEIQKFVCEEQGFRAGNYSFYSNHIENDFLPENLTLLAEYGIPRSAIKKLEKYIPKEMNQDLILEYIKEKQLHQQDSFLKYEKLKIEKNL